MFEQTFLAPPNKTRTAWSTVVSFAVQVALVCTGILVPLLRPDTMPRLLMEGALQAPAPPPGPPPMKLKSVAVVSTRMQRNNVDPSRLVEPARIPEKIAMIIDDKDQPPAVTGDGPFVPGAVGGDGLENGVVDGIANAVTRVAPPPPPPPVAHTPEPARKLERIRVGGDVQAARILRRVIPVYPPLARQMRVSGTVRLVGVIAADGTIQQLQVIEGHPLLVKAAVDAVKQWIYRPTMLNGDPVEVIAPIDVNFTLAQ